MPLGRWPGLVGTIVVAACGGGLATLVGLPASWLSGSMIAVTVASLAGFDTRIPLRLVEVVFLVIGIALGGGVTPEVVGGLASWPISLLGVGISIFAVLFSVRAFLVHVAGWDRDTAFFAALPGALSYVLAVAADTRSDIRKVAVSQSIRVFLLVAVLPSIVLAVESRSPVPAIHAIAPPLGILILFAAGAAVGFAFRYFHVPAALLTGGLLASAILHGAGLVVGTLPDLLVIAAFVLLGALIGSRFVGTKLAFLRRIALASIGAFVIATVVALAIALGVAWLTGEPADQVILALAPGGLDAMTSLAIALNMDSAFVAAHQLARFAGIALVLPFLARDALRRGRDPKV